MATGTFQTELSPIFTSDVSQQVTLKMETMILCEVLVKKNDVEVDNVTLAEGALAAYTVSGQDVPNARLIKLSLQPGDVISAQARLADTVTFTITQ